MLVGGLQTQQWKIELCDTTGTQWQNSLSNTDLPLARTLANTACAVANVMTTLIFIIVSQVTCILSCCCCPLIPPRAGGNWGTKLLFSTR